MSSKKPADSRVWRKGGELFFKRRAKEDLRQLRRKKKNLFWISLNKSREKREEGDQIVERMEVRNGGEKNADGKKEEQKKKEKNKA